MGDIVPDFQCSQCGECTGEIVNLAYKAIGLALPSLPCSYFRAKCVWCDCAGLYVFNSHRYGNNFIVRHIKEVQTKGSDARTRTTCQS